MSYLEQVKKSYESESHTRTVFTYVEKPVERKLFGLIPYTTYATVPEESVITYTKTIKEIKLNVHLVCFIEYNENDRGGYSVNISIDNHKTLEDFIDNIKKNDLYEVSVRLNNFAHFIRDSVLYGKLHFTCIKILKKLPDILGL